MGLVVVVVVVGLVMVVVVVVEGLSACLESVQATFLQDFQRNL